MKNIIKAVLFLFVTVLATQSFAEDDWKHGIGTGFFALNIDGVMGMDTNLLGSVYSDVELNSSELSDVLETAFGIGGVSISGKWKVLYSLQYMELGGTQNGVTGVAAPATIDATFAASGAEVAGVYRFAMTGKNAWGMLGGIRYGRHEFDTIVTSGATTLTKNIDENWTDVVIGLTHDYIISKEWSWNTRVDAGFGGSEGTVLFSTGATWKIADEWVASFNGKYFANEYENGTEGDADWYLYDVDEFGVGANILFMY